MVYTYKGRDGMWERSSLFWSPSKGSHTFTIMESLFLASLAVLLLAGTAAQASGYMAKNLHKLFRSLEKISGFLHDDYGSDSDDDSGGRSGDIMVIFSRAYVPDLVSARRFLECLRELESDPRTRSGVRSRNHPCLATFVEEGPAAVEAGGISKKVPGNEYYSRSLKIPSEFLSRFVYQQVVF